MLSKTRRTSPGNDNIPYWVYRYCSKELTVAVCHIVNMSVGLSMIPSAWRTAIITLVPKCTPVNSERDLWPISVTPILSRMVERLIVKNHIFPSILHAEMFDQFRFKKTGSTMAAIVDIMHKISLLLETNKYVRCLPIDFCKAFDAVDHVIWINKLKSVNISDNLIQWVDFVFNGQNSVY